MFCLGCELANKDQQFVSIHLIETHIFCIEIKTKTSQFKEVDINLISAEKISKHDFIS